MYSIILSASISAQEEKLWACSHPKVCDLLREAIESTGQKQAAKLYSPNLQHSDPHHFSPSPKMIKNLLSCDKLFVRLHAHNKWIKSLLNKRKKDTFTLSSKEKATAHFWLNPSEYCSLRENLQHHIQGKSKRVIEDCLNSSFIKKENNFKVQFKNHFFVLTHDALSSYLKSSSISYLTLKTSHHNDNISPKKLKELNEEIKKHKNIVWILEERISTPNALNKMIKLDHISIEWDPLGKPGQRVLAPLVALFDQLAAIK